MSTEASEHSTRTSAYGVWAAAATVMGLASDLLRPLGPFALYALIVFAAAACVLLALSLAIRALRGPGVFALIGAVVFGAIVSLQALAPQEQGEAKGFIASVAPPVAAVQAELLGAPAPPASVDETQPEAGALAEPAAAPTKAAPFPSTPYSDALERALSDPDPSERVRHARIALSGSDATFTSYAIDRLYRANDPLLRQAAVIALFAERVNKPDFPVTTVDAPDNDANLVIDLLGATLNITRVDPVTGAIGGRFAGRTFSGTISRSGVSLSGSYVRREPRMITDIAITLQGDDDFVLRGVARSETGGAARVEIPIQ